MSDWDETTGDEAGVRVSFPEEPPEGEDRRGARRDPTPAPAELRERVHPGRVRFRPRALLKPAERPPGGHGVGPKGGKDSQKGKGKRREKGNSKSKEKPQKGKGKGRGKPGGNGKNGFKH